MTNTDRRIGKGLLALAIIPALLLAGCGPNVSSNKSTREEVFAKPLMTHENGNVSNYAIRATYGTRVTGGGDAFVEFLPLDTQTLPRGSRNVRYEGNGWYTFLWKGGCYMASVQDSGDSNHMVNINPAHNKQVCDLSEPERTKREEYDHYSTQY